jgi:hypothetical protein
MEGIILVSIRGSLYYAMCGSLLERDVLICVEEWRAMVAPVPDTLQFRVKWPKNRP